MTNSFYLIEDVAKQINLTLKKEKVVRLDDFLEKSNYNELLKDVLKLKFIKSNFPNKFSYSSSKIQKNILKMFLDNSFLAFVEKISRNKINNIDLNLRKFSHRDYVLLHDSLKKEKGVIFLLFLFKGEWKPEFGGKRVFELTKEEIVVEPKKNSLFIVNLERKTRSFVKYINNFAGKNSFFVIEGKLI